MAASSMPTLRRHVKKAAHVSTLRGEDCSAATIGYVRAGGSAIGEVSRCKRRATTLLATLTDGTHVFLGISCVRALRWTDRAWAAKLMRVAAVERGLPQQDVACALPWTRRRRQAHR